MMRMLKKIAGWSWKKKIIGIICMMLILVLGMAGAVFGYAASKVMQRTAQIMTDRCQKTAF